MAGWPCGTCRTECVRWVYCRSLSLFNPWGEGFRCCVDDFPIPADNHEVHDPRRQSSSLSSLPVLRLLDAWLKRVVGSGGKGQGAWHLSSKSCCLVLCQPQRSPLSQATPGQMQFHPGVVQEGTAPVTGHRDCIRDTKRVGHTTAGWRNRRERCTVHRPTVGAREREIVSWWVVG